MKAELRENFIAMNLYSRKENSKINDLSFHFRKLEKEKQLKSKVSKWKITKIRVEINGTENKKSTEKNQQIQKPVPWKDQASTQAN